ncbi:MAG: hypothetical protein FWD71_15115 [Oscillospiraceae bacterium]|nr:hypothetical protein [Oscillospiraceae bacterium]
MSHEIFELLRADNTIYVNRTLAAAIGLNEAVIFSTLLGKEHYYRSAGMLDSEDMFYATASDIEDRTTLTQRQQERAVSHLEELGLISTKIKGLPAKKYFKINPDTEILLGLLREKIKNKPDKDNNSNPDSGNEKIPDTSQQNDETSIDKMSKQDFCENQGSTEQGNQLQQNVETADDEISQPVSTKSENKDSQNGEPINLINNNKYINIKNNNKNNAHTREDTYEEKIQTDNKNYENQADNNFGGIINKFTRNEKVRTAIWEYVKMRLKRPKTVTTDYSLELALKRLSELSPEPETQIKILNQSILNSYPDLYELKNTRSDEKNDYGRNYGNNGRNSGDDGIYYTSLADGKAGANKFHNLPGVVRLG